MQKLLAALSIGQRITILTAAILVCAALWGLTHWKRENDFKPLFTGLASDDAGALVQKLKESAIEYRVSDNGGVILVRSAKVAEVRLEMASAGLPKSGRIGFELFDKTNFGATEFTEHINYRRALEGELERSVMSLSAVEQARVHLTFPKDSVFLDSRQPAKASVMLRIRAGARLTPANVVAVSNLVASAVEGLGPEAVSVLDMRGNLLSRPRRASLFDGSEPSDAILEFRQSIEKDLLAKVNSTLEPLLGAEKFRAGVSVECDFSSGEQSEETFDPTRSVMVTSQKTEDVTGSSAQSGVPGTASNLPRPTSRPAGSSGQVSRRTENIAYQSSRTVRKTRLPQGAVKRMSLSILVDQVSRWEGQGKQMKHVLTPQSAETMKAIHDLIAGVTGFSQERGDQLIVECLPFESTRNPDVDGAPGTPAPGTTPAPVSNLPAWLLKIWPGASPIALAAVAGALLLIPIALVMFLRGRSKRRNAPPESQPALAAAKSERPLGSTAAPRQNLEDQLAGQVALQERMDIEALNTLKLPPVTSKKAEVLAKHLRETVKKDPPQTTQVLRTWITEAES